MPADTTETVADISTERMMMMHDAEAPENWKGLNETTTKPEY